MAGLSLGDEAPDSKHQGRGLPSNFFFMGAAGSLGGEGELESQKQAGGARLFLFPRERWPAPPLSKGEVSVVAEEENHQGRLWMEIFEQPREGLWGGRLKIKNGGGAAVY